MRLDALTPEVVQKAIAVYQDVAYGTAGQPRRAMVEVPDEGSVQSLLRLFHKEVVETVPGYPCHRYSLRLGNRNYPFMKLLFQEHLVVGEFFFAVDTHDQMEIAPDFPDYEAWMALRRFNREIKQEIEAGFAAVGLDTCARVRAVVGASNEGGAPRAGCVLIVDDEEDLAAAVEALLQRRGFSTFKVSDGRQAIAAAGEILPDLVLLDYELPELDGLQVIAKLRSDPATARIPVLLNSAASVSMADIKKADGFLSKPFPEELLYEMIDRVLKSRRDHDEPTGQGPEPGRSA